MCPFDIGKKETNSCPMKGQNISYGNLKFRLIQGFAGQSEITTLQRLESSSYRNACSIRTLVISGIQSCIESLSESLCLSVCP